jgi:predicted RecA/RadA family phage recombinase
MKHLLLITVTVCAVLAGQTPSDNSEGITLLPDRNMDEIREILDGLKTSVQEAYAELLVTAPEASGDITVGFAITPAGEVTDLEITCTEGLETLIDPVTETMTSLDFGSCPGQGENLPVSIPISLLPPRQEQ